MPEAPTGTLTFLFSDIQGSTAMWEQDARRMQLALARHDETLKGFVEEHGGHRPRISRAARLNNDTLTHRSISCQE